MPKKISTESAVLTPKQPAAFDVVKVAIADLTQDPDNARLHSPANLDAIEASLTTFGQEEPIVATRENVVIAGNGRLIVAARMGMTHLWVKYTDLTGSQLRAYAVAANRTSELAHWDDDVLQMTLALLREDADIDHLVAGFTDDEIDALTAIGAPDGGKADRGPRPEGAAAVPWTTVLDARQGYWQNRKREWKASGIESEVGREVNPFCSSGWGNAKPDSVTAKMMKLRGTPSIFDPVLCEILYGWFCPAGGSVLDPFAGGSVRGIIAAEMGLTYTGVDLSSGQIAANREQIKGREMPGSIDWIHGDSATDLPDGTHDFILTCPPYHDLEVYSDNPADISAMDYAGFMAAYRVIIAESVARLKDDRFVAVVIGEVRDSKGSRPLKGLVPLTIEAFEQAGAAYYNDAILVTAMGTVQMACIKPFKSTRKLGRTHQYVLVFCKGDARKAAKACGGSGVAAFAQIDEEVDTFDV